MNDNIGRPIEPNAIDNQEVVRKFDKEQPMDVNYLMAKQEEKKRQDKFGNVSPLKNKDLKEESKVPYIKGDKTICCWNCQTILMVKEEWSVVQCTSCEKINRIPGTDDLNKQIRMN